MTVRMRWQGMVCGFSMVAAALMSGGGAAQAQPDADAKQPAVQQGDPGWPRKFSGQGGSMTLYQPQVDKWTDYRNIELRAALAVKTAGSDAERYGIIEAKGATLVNNEQRTVALTGLGYKVRFPGASEADAAELEKVVRGFLPGNRTVTVGLDRVLAYVNQEDSSLQRDVKVNVDPPRILYSSVPSILVMFLGEPKFQPVVKENPSLLFATNTNWDVFLSTADSKYYVLDGDNWLVSSNPSAGVWEAASDLPASMKNLPKDANWDEARKHIPGSKPRVIPAVFVTTGPAELIVTDGEPTMRPVPGTRLLQISNTTSQVFFHAPGQQYYYLVAGRWFRAANLDGPWSAATYDLPPDFASIPTTDAAGPVRASVKGTQEAKDAVLLASVPQTATVKRSDARLTVEYDGEPKFQPIPGTQVQYAVNTASQVFLTGSTYYCCADGVWFTATAPRGPWTLATEVAKEIYSIPPESPMHNVTYVQVYNSAPDSVTYGYTSGYTGSYVAGGLLMYGAGMALGYALADDHHDDYYHGYYPYPTPYYSYGVAAAYNPYTGNYYRAAGYYGPYGGAGRYAAYNPATGTYGRGAAVYGPYGSASARQVYNPWTDTSAGRAQVTTPNGSASRFYASRGDNAVWGGSRSGSQGSVAWAQGSGGTKGAAWDTARNEGAAIKGPGGDVLVGNDGNIYKREDGQWSKYDNGSWESAGGNKPSPYGAANRNTAASTQYGQSKTASTFPATDSVRQAAQNPASRMSESGAATRNAATAYGQSGQRAGVSQGVNRSTTSDLNRQAGMRTMGESNARTYQGYQGNVSASQRSSSSGFDRSSYGGASGAGRSYSNYSGASRGGYSGGSRGGYSGGGRSGGGGRRR